MAVFTNENIVTSTDLDIRDLSSSTDSVAAIGPLTDTELRATPVPVSGPLTDTELRATPVPISGAVSTTPVVSSTANITRPAVTTTSATILAANANRKKTIIFNEGNGDCFIKFGATASSTSYTYKLTKSMIVEFGIWVGIIDAISSSTSTLQVTELE